MKNKINKLIRDTRNKFLINSSDSRGNYASDVRINGSATILNNPNCYGWNYPARDFKTNINKDLAMHQLDRLHRISKKIYNMI